MAHLSKKNGHADTYFTQLVLSSLFSLANEQGHVITSACNLYDFSEMVRIPTHLSLSKHKGGTIADLAVNSEDTCYLKWLLKQDSISPY